MDLACTLPSLKCYNSAPHARFVDAALTIAIGGLGPALSIGRVVGSAMEALARNPEAQPAIQTNMILGVAFAEAIAIYALVVAIMIGFVF